ncbi:MAG: MarR family transcriptional regulator [Mobilitalea sp.]
MELNWMGKNRYFVERLIKFGNLYATIYNKEHYYGTDVKISFAQIQVVEYLLENEELNQNMSMIAERLGISSSNFTKLVQKLEAKELLKKYNTEENKKNIIIRVTDTGRSVYKVYSEFIVKHYFAEIFDITAEIPPEYILLFAKILDVQIKTDKVSPEEKAVNLVPIQK